MKRFTRWLSTPPNAPRSPPQPSSTSTPTPTPPPPLSALLAMSQSSLSHLPIHTLKQILFDARVRLPTDLLERGELVARVSAWVEQERGREESERRERERREQEEREQREREELEELERMWVRWTSMLLPTESEDAQEERGQGEREELEELERMWVRWTSMLSQMESEDAQEERGQGERDELEELERMWVRWSSMPSQTESGDAQMRDDDHDEFQQHHPPPPTSSSSPLPPPETTTSTYRSGLCVICQDQEANIAIMDCGCVPSLFVISFRSHLIWLFSLTLMPTQRHLAMCRPCAERVLASSRRECPLCRTRIVTEARLLRIFKT